MHHAQSPQPKRYTVNLGDTNDTVKCSCVFQYQYKMPCRHIIAAAMVTGLTNKDFPTFVALTFDRMYILENYIEALQGPSIQLVALDELVPDGTTRPMKNVAQKGRPKKKRIRSRGEAGGAGGSGGRAQKCSCCKGVGHNVSTCTKDVAF